MLHSLVILLTAFVFILFIAAIHWESQILAVLNTVLFFVLGIVHVSIEIPWVAITSGDVVETGYMVHSDMGSGVLMWIFAFISVVFFITFKFKEMNDDVKNL